MPEPEQSQDPFGKLGDHKLWASVVRDVLMGSRVNYPVTAAQLGESLSNKLAANVYLNPDGIELNELSFVLTARCGPDEIPETTNHFSITLWHGTKELGETLGNLSRDFYEITAEERQRIRNIFCGNRPDIVSQLHGAQ